MRKYEGSKKMKEKNGKEEEGEEGEEEDRGGGGEIAMVTILLFTIFISLAQKCDFISATFFSPPMPPSSYPPCESIPKPCILNSCI